MQPGRMWCLVIVASGLLVLGGCRACSCTFGEPVGKEKETQPEKVTRPYHAPPKTEKERVQAGETQPVEKELPGRVKREPVIMTKGARRSFFKRSRGKEALERLKQDPRFRPAPDEEPKVFPTAAEERRKKPKP